MPVLTNLGNGLAVVYVVDQGESLLYVNNSVMQSEGLTQEELHAIGVQNLLGLASQRELSVRAFSNIFGVFLDGNFEASLILLDALWNEHFRQFVPGDYLMAVPARDVLAFCDANSAEACADLQNFVNSTAGKVDHPLSQSLFRRTGNSWAPLTTGSD